VAEAALSDAGLADHADHLSFTGASRLEGKLQRPHLLLAADEA